MKLRVRKTYSAFGRDGSAVVADNSKYRQSGKFHLWSAHGLRVERDMRRREKPWERKGGGNWGQGARPKPEEKTNIVN